MQSRGSISFTVPPLTLERGMPLTDGGQACEVPRGQVVDISRSKEDEQGRGKGGTNKKGEREMWRPHRMETDRVKSLAGWVSL